MIRVKIWAVLFGAISFLACGESSFTGTSAPQKTPEKTASASPSKKGDATDAEAQDTANKNKNSALDAGVSAGADTADPNQKLGTTDVASASPTPDGSDAGAPGRGAPATSEDGKWRADQIITDLVTLEECKMDIYKRTGDMSICVQCFSQFMSAGSITAGACGCAWAAGSNP